MSDMSTRRRGESAIAILNHKVQYERELSRSMKPIQPYSYFRNLVGLWSCETVRVV